MKPRRGGGYSFKPRECWICGRMLNSISDCDFLPRPTGELNRSWDDYTGYCKEHNIRKILQKYGSDYQLIKVKDKRMRRLIVNMFLIGLFIEILIYLPKIIVAVFK